MLDLVGHRKQPEAKSLSLVKFPSAAGTEQTGVGKNGCRFQESG